MQRHLSTMAGIWSLLVAAMSALQVAAIVKLAIAKGPPIFESEVRADHLIVTLGFLVLAGLLSAWKSVFLWALSLGQFAWLGVNLWLDLSVLYLSADLPDLILQHWPSLLAIVVTVVLIIMKRFMRPSASASPEGEF